MLHLHALLTRDDTQDKRTLENVQWGCRCDPPATQILLARYIQHSTVSTTYAALIPTVPRWEELEPDKVTVTL